MAGVKGRSGRKKGQTLEAKKTLKEKLWEQYVGTPAFVRSIRKDVASIKDPSERAKHKIALSKLYIPPAKDPRDEEEQNLRISAYSALFNRKRDESEDDEED